MRKVKQLFYGYLGRKSRLESFTSRLVDKIQEEITTLLGLELMSSTTCWGGVSKVAYPEVNQKA